MLFENKTFVNFSECPVKIKKDKTIIRNCIFKSPCKGFKFAIYLEDVKDCIIEDCVFMGFKQKGLCIFLNRKTNKSNNLIIRNCEFINLWPVDGVTNGLETIRIGTSHMSLSNSNSIIDNCTFINCQAEKEVISIKSCGNIIKNNVFHNSRSLTLRHGNDNQVINNTFVRSEGIRVCGENHILMKNIFYECENNILLLYGQKDPKLNGYAPVKNVKIDEQNTSISNHVQKPSCIIEPDFLKIF